MPAAENLKPLLSNLLRRAESSFRDRSHRIWEVWEHAVGPDLAQRSYPVTLRAGRLTVAVQTSAWMQQLSFLREELRANLNRAVGDEAVREVRFRLAEVAPPPPPRRVAPPPPWLCEPLDPARAAQIDAEVQAVSDPELRERIRLVRIRAEQIRCFRSRPEDPAAPQPPPSTPPRGRAGRAAT